MWKSPWDNRWNWDNLRKIGPHLWEIWRLELFGTPCISKNHIAGWRFFDVFWSPFGPDEKKRLGWLTDKYNTENGKATFLAKSTTRPSLPVYNGFTLAVQGLSGLHHPPSFKFTPKKALDGRGCRKLIIISRLLTVTPWYQAFTGIVPSAFTIVAEHSWVCWESDPVNRIVGRRVCWSLQVPRHFWESFLTYTRRKGAPFEFAWWHFSHLLTFGKLNAGILAPLLLVACRLSVLGHAPLGDLPRRDTANN